MTVDNSIHPAEVSAHLMARNANIGALLVFGSALSWSAGGLIARMADVDSPWATVFWRSGTAALFLIAYMLLRDGPKGTRKLFAEMGWPGLAVGACFAIASTTFVVALQHTTVANVLLMQAGVPLIAALLSWVFFQEKLRASTWLAIFVVICGVAVMVSDSLTGNVSPLGDGLALVIAIVFALATVLSRRFSNIRMTPAVCIGALIGCLVALMLGLYTSGSVVVSPVQFLWLVAFGLTMGIGMALFASGVRLIPSAFAALLGTAETILGPIWVWIAIGEVPSFRTLLGGSIVMAALIGYLAWQLHDNYRISRIAPPAS